MVLPAPKADMVIAAFAGKLSKLGLLEPHHSCTWQPRASMPASSSSSTDPPAAKAQSIPKRLQNRPMSKLAAKQTRHRMEARHYLTCLYKRVAGFFWISFFNPTTGVTKVGKFGPGTLYSHLYADVRSMFGVQKGPPMSMRIWDPYSKWVMTAPGQARLNNVVFGGMTLYCTFYRYTPDEETVKYVFI